MIGVASPAAAVLDALRVRGMTLAVAESLTGGALSAALVAVPGASDVLNGAVVAYATPENPSRVRALMRVHARDLLDVLHALRQEGRFAVEHVYEY